MKTVQRERRYVCGQTKQNAVYQEIEIYTVGTDQKSRQREKQKVTPVPFRGKNPEHWDGHNTRPYLRSGDTTSWMNITESKVLRRA